MVDISVVIPTFDRESLLRRTIPAFVEQQSGPFSYEVIFVINGSTDGSEVFLREAATRWPGKIRYFRIAGSGSPAAPRNVGIRAAKGNVIVLVDDDVVPDPDFVLQHATFHRDHPDPKFVALGELTIPEEVLDDPVSFFHEFISYEQFRGRERLHYLDFWTCNVSVKRQFMLDHGMFEEALLYFEDGLCGYRLSQHGMELRFVPQAKGQHLHQMQLTSVVPKGQLIGRCLYQFEQLVPEAEVRRRYGILSSDIGAIEYGKRLVKRALLFGFSNPLVMPLWKALAEMKQKRSRFSDFYYYLLLRRAILLSYRQAKKTGVSWPGTGASRPASSS